MPLFSSLNIRSKIIAAMLAAAALTGLTQAWLGNDNVQDGYSSSLQTRLSAIAEITAGRVEGYFANARAIATSLGEDLMVAEALGEFTNSIGISVMSSPPKMVERMKEYYADNYVSRLVTNDGSTPLVDALVPDSVPARFLQFHYVLRWT